MQAVATTAQKYRWDCPECGSRFFSEPVTLGVRNGQLVKIHPICTNCFSKCRAGHEFGYGEACNVCGDPRRRFNLIRHEIDPDDPTFGITTTGNTTYPTTTETVAGTDDVSEGWQHTLISAKITITNNATISTVGLKWGSAGSGKFVVGVYSHNAGADKPASLLTQSTEQTHTVGANWQDATVTAYYIAAGTYWLACWTNGAETARFDAAGGPRRSYKTSTYSSTMPGTWPADSTEDAVYALMLRVTYWQIAGYVKLTKATLSEAAASITSMSLYFHATGNFYAGIYTDSSGPAVLKWTSESTPATGGGAWDDVLISAGTPNTLALAAGDYWLAWQWDSVNAGPSYTLGGANTGAYLAQAYGAFPDPMTGETLSTENWSEYVTYAIYMINGITRDSAGDPLGSCTVWLFKTSDKSYLASTTSDPTTGAYSVPAPDNTTQCFVRAHKDGTNVFGTTDRDLVGQ